ncbi:hypothetical protein CVT24_002498 [Panaeolus cyanescens]|uniref:RING-type domain-containing protein n=1 Tax=Panaeolus cyanescens TaxID=181874 RepID=A0A409WBR7_9AGAR|nr:hypothetical protein CVT24_002498 [Panaeolus cyanescens]
MQEIHGSASTYPLSVIERTFEKYFSGAPYARPILDSISVRVDPHAHTTAPSTRGSIHRQATRGRIRFTTTQIVDASRVPITPAGTSSGSTSYPRRQVTPGDIFYAIRGRPTAASFSAHPHGHIISPLPVSNPIAVGNTVASSTSDDVDVVIPSSPSPPSPLSTPPTRSPRLSPSPSTNDAEQVSPTANSEPNDRSPNLTSTISYTSGSSSTNGLDAHPRPPEDEESKAKTSSNPSIPTSERRGDVEPLDPMAVAGSSSSPKKTRTIKPLSLHDQDDIIISPEALESAFKQLAEMFPLSRVPGLGTQVPISVNRATGNPEASKAKVSSGFSTHREGQDDEPLNSIPVASTSSSSNHAPTIRPVLFRDQNHVVPPEVLQSSFKQLDEMFPLSKGPLADDSNLSTPSEPSTPLEEEFEIPSSPIQPITPPAEETSGLQIFLSSSPKSPLAELHEAIAMPEYDPDSVPPSPLIGSDASSIIDEPPMDEPEEPREDLIQCSICFDDTPPEESFQSSCSHVYCADCVERLVDNFTRDELLFPFRCCQEPIAPQDVVPFISDSLRKLFNEKLAEYSAHFPLSLSREIRSLPWNAQSVDNALALNWKEGCVKFDRSISKLANHFPTFSPVRRSKRRQRREPMTEEEEEGSNKEEV